jgi:group I intron endonuclease
VVFIDEEEKYNEFGIYCIRNLTNNKRYIGQTGESFQRRFWHHRWKLQNGCHDNSHLQQSWNKYGASNFVFEVIETVESKSSLDAKEIEYIKLYKEKGLVYNMSLGGGGKRGFRMKESSKKLIGEKNRINMTGRKHSKETKLKMSEARTGLTYSKYRKTTVITNSTAYTIKEMLVSGVSASDVAKVINVSYSIVNAILSNNTWKDVEVDGWEEFQSGRKKTYRLTRDDADKIRSLAQNGLDINDIAKRYNKTRHSISNIINYRTFK